MTSPAGARRRPELAVGAVAVVGAGLLLVQRGRDPQRGRWTIPGGRVEWHEPLSVAVEREVREETGVAVSCGPLLGWAERMDPAHHFVILDFTVTVPSPGAVPVAGGDATAARWVALGELDGVALVDGLHAFLAAHGVLD